MKFTIKDGILEDYQCDNGETNIVIPEGVTGIGKTPSQKTIQSQLSSC